MKRSFPRCGATTWIQPFQFWSRTTPSACVSCSARWGKSKKEEEAGLPFTGAGLSFPGASEHFAKCKGDYRPMNPVRVTTPGLGKRKSTRYPVLLRKENPK